MAKPPKQGAVAHAVGTKPGRKNSLPSLLRQTKGSGTGAARLIPFKQRTHVAPKVDVPPPFTTLLADQRGGSDQISDLTDPPIIHSAPPPIEEILPSQQSATSSLSQSSRDARTVANAIPGDEPVWGNEKKVKVSIIGKSDQTFLSTLGKPHVPKTPKTSSERKTMSLTGRVSVLTPSPVTLSRVVVQQPLQVFQPRVSSQQLQEQREAMKSPITDAAVQDVDSPSPLTQLNRHELQHQLSPQTDASVVMSHSVSENDSPLRAFDNNVTKTTGTMKASRTGEKLSGGHQIGKKVAFSKVKALLSRVGKKQPPSVPLIIEQVESSAVKVAGIPVVPSYEPHAEWSVPQLGSEEEEDIIPAPVVTKQPTLKVKAASPEAMRFGPASPSLRGSRRASFSVESTSPIHTQLRYGSPERASRLPPNPESPIRILRLQSQTESPEHEDRSTFQIASPERRVKAKVRSPRSKRGLDPDDDASPTKPDRVPVDAPEVAVDVDEEDCAELKPMERRQNEAAILDDVESRNFDSLTPMNNIIDERREGAFGHASDLVFSMNEDPRFPEEDDDDEKSHLSVQGIAVFDSLDDDDEGIVYDDETDLRKEDLEHNPFVDTVTAERMRAVELASVDASQEKISAKLPSNSISKVSLDGTSVKTGPAEIPNHHNNTLLHLDQPNYTERPSPIYNDEDDDEEIDVFEAIAFPGRQTVKSMNPFDEGSDEEGIPVPKTVEKEASLKSALKVKGSVQKPIRKESSVGPLSDRTGSKQNLKKKAESKASKHRTAQDSAAKITSSDSTNLQFPRNDETMNQLKALAPGENKPVGLALLPDEVMMDESGTISDLDQSLRHFPLRLVEASDRTIDVSGLGHTRDAEETISTRASFEEVIDRYTVSPTQELLRLRTKGVNFAEDGKKSPALADSITESDNTPPPSNVSVPDVPPGLCDHSFVGQAWMARFLVRPNEVVTGKGQTKEDIKPAPEIDVTTDNTEGSLATFPMKETVSGSANNSNTVSFIVEPKINQIASILASKSSDDDSEVILPVKEALGASSQRSHYEETPRISNEASRAPDADGVLVGGGSIVGVRSSESSKVANDRRGLLEPTTYRASRDEGRHFFTDQDAVSDFAKAQDKPHGGLPASFGSGKLQKLKPPMASPSSDIETVFDKYHAIEDNPPFGRLAPMSLSHAKVSEHHSGLKPLAPAVASGEMSPSNEDSVHLLQTSSRASFLERLFVFGQEAIGMSTESKHNLQCRMQQMSPSSKSLVEKAIQKAEIESALTFIDERHAFQEVPTQPNTPILTSNIVKTERDACLESEISTRKDDNKVTSSMKRGIISTELLPYEDRVLQLRSSGSQVFPGWSTSLGGSQSYGEHDTGISSFRWREGVLSTDTHGSIVNDIHSSSIEIKLPTESVESPSDQETWYSLRDEWKQLNRELEGGMNIMSNKSRDMIMALLHEAAGATEAGITGKSPAAINSDDEERTNFKSIAREESLLGHVVSEELIDLTAIGSYDDLQDEEAVWLFDLDNGLSNARLGQSVISCAHLESLMEFAVEKLSLLPTTNSSVLQRVGQELKNEVPCNDAHNDHATSPFLTLQQSFGLNSLRKIETTSDIGNLVQSSSELKTPMAMGNTNDSVGDFCQVSPPKESRHEHEGLPDATRNKKAARSNEEATLQIGVRDTAKKLEAQLDDLLFGNCNEADCNQLGYEIVPVGAEAIMLGTGSGIMGDHAAARELEVSPSSAAGDRYDSIGVPPDKYDTFDDDVRRAGSDDELSSDGSSVSSNDGFAEILEKVKRDLGEATIPVDKTSPAQENQKQIQTSRQPQCHASPVSEIVHRRDFLDMLFDGTLICGTDKQIEVVHSSKKRDALDQRGDRKVDLGIRRERTDESESISLLLPVSANPRSNSLNVVLVEQLGSKKIHPAAHVKDKGHSASPRVESHEIFDASAEPENRALLKAISMEYQAVPSAADEDRESAITLEDSFGQKEDLHDRVSQLCNTNSDSNVSTIEEGTVSCHTDVISPSPPSRTRASLCPLVESDQKIGLRQRVNKLCNTISDNTIASASMTEEQLLQITDTFGAKYSEQPIKSISNAVSNKEIRQLESSSALGDARDDDSTTGIVMSNDDIISPYVTDVVKEVLFSLGSDLSAKSVLSPAMASLGEGIESIDGDIMRDRTMESMIASGSERASQLKRAPKPENFISHLTSQVQASGERNNFLHVALSHGRTATDASKSAGRVAPKPEDFLDRIGRPPEVLCIKLTNRLSPRESFISARGMGDKIETDDNEHYEIETTHDNQQLITTSPRTTEHFAEALVSLNEVESVAFDGSEKLTQDTFLSNDKKVASAHDRPSDDKEFIGNLVSMLLSDGQEETTVGPSAALMFSKEPVQGISQTTGNQADNVPFSVTLLNEKVCDIVALSWSGSGGPAVSEGKFSTSDTDSNLVYKLDSFADEFTLNSQILAGLTSMHANTMEGESTSRNIPAVYGTASSDVSATAHSLESDSSENMQLSGSNVVLSDISTLNSQAFVGMTDLLEKLSVDRTDDSYERRLHGKSSETLGTSGGSAHLAYASMALIAATDSSETSSRNLDSSHADVYGDQPASPANSIAIADDTSRRDIDDAKPSNMQGNKHQKNISLSVTWNDSPTSPEEITVTDSIKDDNFVVPEAFAVLSPRQSYSADLFEVTESIVGQTLDSPLIYQTKRSMHGLPIVSSQEFPATLTMKVATNSGKDRSLLHLLGSRPETPIVINDTEIVNYGCDHHSSTMMLFHSDVRRSLNISLPKVQLSLSPQTKHFDFSDIDAVGEDAAFEERSAALSIRGTPLVLGFDVNLTGHTEPNISSIIANHAHTSIYDVSAGYEELPHHHTLTPSTDTANTGNSLLLLDNKCKMKFGWEGQSKVDSSSQVEIVSSIPVVHGGDLHSRDNYLRWVHPSRTMLSTTLESIVKVTERDDDALARSAYNAMASMTQAPLISGPESEACVRYRPDDNVSNVQMSQMNPSSTVREQSGELPATLQDNSKDPNDRLSKNDSLEAIEEDTENRGIASLLENAKPFDFVVRDGGISALKSDDRGQDKNEKPSLVQDTPLTDLNQLKSCEKDSRDASRENSHGDSRHVSDVIDVERKTEDRVERSFASADPDVIIIESSSRSTTALSLAKQARVVKLSTLGSSFSVATESMVESDSKSCCGSKVSNSIPREISVTTRLVYGGIEVETDDTTTPVPTEYLNATKRNQHTLLSQSPTAFVPNILASLGLSRGSDWSECNPIMSLAEVLDDDREIDDCHESTSLLLALTRSETSDSVTTHCSSYDDSRLALRDVKSSFVEGSGPKVSQSGYRCKIDRLRGIAKEASKLSEERNAGTEQNHLSDASVPGGQKEPTRSPLLNSLLRRLTKQGLDSQSSREANVQQETATIPRVPLPPYQIEKVKQGDALTSAYELPPGSIASHDETAASLVDEEREVYDDMHKSIDFDGAMAKIPHSVEIHTKTGPMIERKINAATFAETLNRDDDQKAPSGDSEERTTSARTFSVRRASPKEQPPPQSVEVLSTAQKPKPLPQLSNVMDRLRIISEKSDSFSFTSSDVEPLDVEELFHRYDNIVKHMVVLDESKLARVQSKQKESLPLGSGSTFRLATASRSPTSRLNALTVDNPDDNVEQKQQSRRTSFDSHISSHHGMIVSPVSGERSDEDVLTATVNNPQEQLGRGKRLNRLKLQKSQSTGSAQIRSSASTDSSHLSQKARNLRKQLENALQQSAVIRSSQEKLGKEITTFKQKMQDRRAASPQPQQLLPQPTAAERASPNSSTKSIGSSQSKAEPARKSNVTAAADQDANTVDFESATIAKAIQCLTIESSDSSVCLTDRSPRDRIRDRHSRHVKDSPTSQHQKRATASSPSSSKTPDLIQVPSSIVTISSSKMTTPQVDEDIEMQYSDDEGDDHVVQLQQIESIVSGLFRTESTNSMAAADKPKLSEKLASPRLKRTKSKSPSFRNSERGLTNLSVSS